MSNYRFAIPTYKRYQGLGEKTLKTLDKFGFDKDIIDIFVNNKEEYEIYKPLYPDYNIIIGELGMRQIRQFIINYYDEGDKIIHMDDDITDIKMKNPKSWEKSSLEEIENLHQEIDLAFELCEKHNTVLWGIYPCDNHMFMKNEPSTHLAFCVGWMWGCIIDKEVLKLDCRTIGNYEDYERSIKVFKKYRSIIRLNYLCAKTKYNAPNSGGMCIGDRSIGMKSDLDILMSDYSDYLILKKKKSNILGVNPQIKSNIR